MALMGDKDQIEVTGAFDAIVLSTLLMMKFGFAEIMFVNDGY